MPISVNYSKEGMIFSYSNETEKNTFGKQNSSHSGKNNKSTKKSNKDMSPTSIVETDRHDKQKHDSFSNANEHRTAIINSLGNSTKVLKFEDKT